MNFGQKRHWVGTIWAAHVGLDDEYSEEEIIDGFVEYWSTLEQLPNLRYLGGQIEKSPRTGNLHIQFYLEFKQSYRLKTIVSKMFKAHLEPRMGSRDDARAYCLKTDSRIMELPVFGEWRPEKVTQPSPKQRVLAMLKMGFSPEMILERDIDAYFTHHRSINAVYNLICKSGVSIRTPGEEE